MLSRRTLFSTYPGLTLFTFGGAAMLGSICISMLFLRAVCEPIVRQLAFELFRQGYHGHNPYDPDIYPYLAFLAGGAAIIWFGAGMYVLRRRRAAWDRRYLPRDMRAWIGSGVR
jgi:hypothetical protein